MKDFRTYASEREKSKEYSAYPEEKYAQIIAEYLEAVCKDKSYKYEPNPYSYDFEEEWENIWGYLDLVVCWGYKYPKHWCCQVVSLVKEYYHAPQTN